jgi:hypothetical protein
LLRHGLNRLKEQTKRDANDNAKGEIEGDGEIEGRFKGTREIEGDVAIRVICSDVSEELRPLQSPPTPIFETSLRSTLSLFGRGSPSLPGRRSIVSDLIAAGDLKSAMVDGIRYLWPAGRISRKPAVDGVRSLAPFDPVVWDRRRFEHLWAWPYRFEAYVPPAKRKLG